MKLKIVCLILVLMAINIGTTSAERYDYIEPPEYLWSCFDYAMHFSQDNPEWGMVIISNHPRFWTNEHVVNYKIDEDKSLILYDAGVDSIRIVRGWEYDSYTFDYYHFYMSDEIPTRQRKYHLPNAEKRMQKHNDA